METHPISPVMAIDAYQLPVARDYAPGMGVAHLSPPAQPDTVEISAAARERAAQETMTLWGEVRFDYPHHDDPDLPWEVRQQEWMNLMAKVFKKDQAKAS